jgi:hypothetical protein
MKAIPAQSASSSRWSGTAPASSVSVAVRRVDAHKGVRRCRVNPHHRAGAVKNDGFSADDPVQRRFLRYA